METAIATNFLIWPLKPFSQGALFSVDLALTALLISLLHSYLKHNNKGTYKVNLFVKQIDTLYPPHL